MEEKSGSHNISDDLGNTPEIDENLISNKRTVSSIDQAFSVCDTLVSDWKEGISKAARITRKLNGERPYNQAALKKAGKEWKTNISTGFLATECSKVIPRLFMPVKTAKYLTAAQLPANWPGGEEKTNFFRQTISDQVRSWPKFNFYIRGLAREVGVWGFAFNCFYDEFDWRPNLVRMDRGFVPQGTEIMDEPAFFMAKYDYKPSDLLDLLKASQQAGRDEWQKDACVKAINSACAPVVESTSNESRTYEELVRQSTWSFSYKKGTKLIRTYHLFAKEPDGAVSHYVLLADKGRSSTGEESRDEDRLLYEYLDQYQSMADAVNTMVFDYGDGTIHGVWGAGQILYDMAAQVEKIRCDSIDNIRLTNKAKIQVVDGKNVNDVKAVVNDQFVIVSGAQFAGNSAGIGSDVQGYELLDQKLSMLAQQKIGAFIPPIPLQPNDIKAAQINAQAAKEKELQEALLENWLIQFAELMRAITKRLVNPDSPDPVSRATIALLLEKLSPEEIMLMAGQFPVKSVMDFTEFKAQQRGQFAFSVLNNPLFRQATVARIMAEGAGDEAFVASITLPEGDQTDGLAAQRQQTMETTSLQTGKPIPVLPHDNDWAHMQTLKPDIMTLIAQDFDPAVALNMLQHYGGHWSSGVNKKQIPKDKINEEKHWMSGVEKVVGARQEQIAFTQRAAAAVAGAQEQANAMVQAEAGGQPTEQPQPGAMPPGMPPGQM